MVQKIMINTDIDASIDKVWECWTTPEDICHWNFASADWKCPNALNNLIVGGTFSYRMEAKDGSVGFDITGLYTKIVDHQLIHYKLDDERTVEVKFEVTGGQTVVTEIFEAENMHLPEQQREGWQAILNNFKTYVEQK